MNFFEADLSRIPGRGWLLLLLLGLVSLIIFLASMVTDPLTTLLVTVAMLFILVLIRPIWVTPAYGAYKVRIYSLWLVVLVTATQGGWGELLSPLFKELLSYLGLEWQNLIPSAPGFLSGLVVVLTVLVVAVVNGFMRPNLAMGQHLTPLEKEFPEKSYQNALKDFCSILKDDLDTVDYDTNWSFIYFYVFIPYSKINRW